jgi:hypothetical protein
MELIRSLKHNGNLRKIVAGNGHTKSPTLASASGEALWPPWQCIGASLHADGRHLMRLRAARPADPDYVIDWFFPSGTRQGDLGLKENGEHRKRNRAAAIAMEAIIEERTPLRVLKQPHFRGV